MTKRKVIFPRTSTKEMPNRYGVTLTFKIRDTNHYSPGKLENSVYSFICDTREAQFCDPQRQWPSAQYMEGDPYSE